MTIATPKPTIDTLGEWFHELLIEQLGVELEDITPAAGFVDELGADSLDTIEIFMACEQALGLEIPDEDAAGLRTVGEAVDYLTKRMAVK